MLGAAVGIQNLYGVNGFYFTFRGTAIAYADVLGNVVALLLVVGSLYFLFLSSRAPFTFVWWPAPTQSRTKDCHSAKARSFWPRRGAPSAPPICPTHHLRKHLWVQTSPARAV